MRITVGQGKTRPHGLTRAINAADGRVHALANALLGLPSDLERWLSLSTFDKSPTCDVPKGQPACQNGATSHRKSDAWLSTCGGGVDVDSIGHVSVSDVDRARLDDWMQNGDHGGNLSHHTPHGARVIYVLGADEANADRARTLQGSLRDRVRESLRQAGLHDVFEVDEGATTDICRWWWAPRARVGGVQRDAAVEVLREEPYDVHELVTAQAATRGPVTVASTRHASFEDAVHAYNAAHPAHWPRSSGTCPACGHNGCFGVLPDHPSRWCCFSSNHASDSDGCGLKGEKAWIGDALDLASHAAGCSRRDLLVRERLLPERSPAVDAPKLPRPHTLDDLGNAERIKEHFGEGYVRCLNVDARRCEWLAWEPRRERWDRGEEAHARLHAASSQLHRRIKREMDAHAPGPRPLSSEGNLLSRAGKATKAKHEAALKRRSPWIAFYRRSRNVSMQTAARTQLRSLGGIYLPESKLDHPDRTAHYLGFADGVYDLRMGKRIRNAPELFITRYAAVPVAFDMPTPLWDETMKNMASHVDSLGHQALDHERLAFLEVAIGISMFGNPARHVFVMDGPSGTVKSTTAGALQHCLGEVACGIPTSVLCASASSGGEGPAPYTASLHGRRVAFSQEATQNQVWNTGALKSLTSGEMVPARGLYGNPFSFVNTADIWLTTNSKPRIPDADAACWTRISVFPCDGPIFPRPADYDPDNPKHRTREATFELRLRSEAPGIAARVIAYARRAHELDFELPACAAVEAARHEYREESKTQLERFIDDTIAPAGADHGLLTTVVYARFLEWYRENCRDSKDPPPQEVVTKEIGRVFASHAKAGGQFARVQPAKRVRGGEAGYGRRWGGLRWQ